MNKRNIVELIGQHDNNLNNSNSSITVHDNIQMYKDAMKLGSSITKLLTSIKSMQTRFKSRYFDQWKV